MLFGYARVCSPFSPWEGFLVSLRDAESLPQRTRQVFQRNRVTRRWYIYLFLWDRKNKCKYDPPVYKLVVCTRDIISCCAVVLAQHFGQTTRFPRQPRKAWLRARQYAIWGSQLFSPQAQKTVFVEDFTVFQICLWRGKILSPLFKLAAGAIFFGPFFYSPVVEQENKGFDPNTSLFEVREAFQRTLLLGFRAFIRAYPAMFWPPSGGP